MAGRVYESLWQRGDNGGGKEGVRVTFRIYITTTSVEHQDKLNWICRQLRSQGFFFKCCIITFGLALVFIVLMQMERTRGQFQC